MIAIVKNCDCDIHEVISRAKFAGNVEDAERYLFRWLNMSEPSWLGIHDSDIACIWGLVPSSVISDRAYLWLLTTDVVDEHKFVFIRHSQLIIEETLKEYSMIVGHVANGNERAKRWLKWLGAKLSLPNKDGFIPFEIRRKTDG